MAKVLLIEDDFYWRAVLKNELEARGHSVFEAANAVGAEAAHMEYGFDVVITDLIMPERDGFELLMAFRRRFPRVRIIAMSAGGSMGAPEYLQMAKQLGADETVRKPVSGAQLEALFLRLLPRQ
jgi:CheY-like chemotaxis protein